MTTMMTIRCVKHHVYISYYSHAKLKASFLYQCLFESTPFLWCNNANYCRHGVIKRHGLICTEMRNDKI